PIASREDDLDLSLWVRPALVVLHTDRVHRAGRATIGARGSVTRGRYRRSSLHGVEASWNNHRHRGVSGRRWVSQLRVVVVEASGAYIEFHLDQVRLRSIFATAQGDDGVSRASGNRRPLNRAHLDSARDDGVGESIAESDPGVGDRAALRHYASGKGHLGRGATCA